MNNTIIKKASCALLCALLATSATFNIAFAAKKADDTADAEGAKKSRRHKGEGKKGTHKCEKCGHTNKGDKKGSGAYRARTARDEEPAKRREGKEGMAKDTTCSKKSCEMKECSSKVCAEKGARKHHHHGDMGKGSKKGDAKEHKHRHHREGKGERGRRNKDEMNHKHDMMVPVGTANDEASAHEASK